jgi:archaellum component FlaC
VHFCIAKAPDAGPERLQQPMTSDRAVQARMERLEAEIGHLKHQFAAMRSTLERLN